MRGEECEVKVRCHKRDLKVGKRRHKGEVLDNAVNGRMTIFACKRKELKLSELLHYIPEANEHRYFGHHDVCIHNERFTEGCISYVEAQLCMPPNSRKTHFSMIFLDVEGSVLPSEVDAQSP